MSRMERPEEPRAIRITLGLLRATAVLLAIGALVLIAIRLYR